MTGFFSLSVFFAFCHVLKINYDWIYYLSVFFVFWHVQKINYDLISWVLCGSLCLVVVFKHSYYFWLVVILEKYNLCDRVNDLLVRTTRVNGFNVTPCSFAVACALGAKVQVICARSKGNVNLFRYFIASTWAPKAKLTLNFIEFLLWDSVKFGRLLINTLL